MCLNFIFMLKVRKHSYFRMLKSLILKNPPFLKFCSNFPRAAALSWGTSIRETYQRAVRILRRRTGSAGSSCLSSHAAASFSPDPRRWPLGSLTLDGAHLTVQLAGCKPCGFDPSLFPRLILIWINADFRVPTRIFQHLFRSTWLASWIFENLQTFALFSNYLIDVHRNLKMFN